MAENAFSRIEHQLAAALQDTEPTQAPAVKSPGTSSLTSLNDDHLSARELRQMAYDRVEQELAQLHDNLRRLRQRHKEEESTLLHAIAAKKRLRRTIVGEPEQDKNS